MNTRLRERSLLGMVVAALALGWAATVAANDNQNNQKHNQKFPATGQTTCYDSAGTVIACAGTGQDGDIRAGAALRYRDNGNGTIKDRNTELVWEKKSDDGSIHDMDNLYFWDDAFAMHVATLNNICKNDETVDCSVNGDADCAGKCGFAGKRDWRVPNVKELLSIINYQNRGPAVSDAFKTPCVSGATTVLTGSCTTAAPYWSSTSFAGDPIRPSAWLVNFGDGGVGFGGKSGPGPFRVRAVRGGL